MSANGEIDKTFEGRLGPEPLLGGLRKAYFYNDDWIPAFAGTGGTGSFRLTVT
jgi:hypothetical protein